MNGSGMGLRLIVLLSVGLPLSVAFAEERGESCAPGRVISSVVSDHREFYSSRPLGHLALGLVGAWVLANTEADVDVQDWYREEVRAPASDDLSEWIKPLGNGRIAVPALAGVAIVGKLAGDAPGAATVHRWAGRSLRALLLGAPPVLFLQVAVGSSRPGEADSRWRPFEDDNGVSGHAFVGAVPFLSAARMAHSRPLKTICYAGSILCGLSRINDDAHYFSQAAMGWWVAYLATGSVDRTQRVEQKFSLQHTISPGTMMTTVGVRF
jgi:membrane-associated phospholipid phosphatase